MTAGGGASEQSRRAAERVEKARRELEKAERNQRMWEAGAAGEVLVAGRLAELEADGWRILHDVHWPGRPKANIDHVLVGPGGLLVIDSKNWSGRVAISNDGLYQNGYSRRRFVESAEQQAASIAALLDPPYRRHVQAWLCLAGHRQVDGQLSGAVKVYGADTVRDAVRTLPRILEPQDVEMIHARLQQLLAGPASPDLLTTRTVRDPRNDLSTHTYRTWQDHRRGRRDQPAEAIPQPVIPRQPDPKATPPLSPANRRRKRRFWGGALRILLGLTLGAVLVWIVAVLLVTLIHPDPPTSPPPVQGLAEIWPPGPPAAKERNGT